MSLRTAAQQALEALEKSIDTVRNEYEGDWRHGMPTREKQLSAMRELVEKHEAAITALRTALAEPEQEPVQVTPIDFVTAVLGKEDCVGKPIMWAEWPNRAHGIGGEA
jgi:hypothetical protein